MTGPTIQRTTLSADPTMKDLLDLWSRNLKIDINCHAIATVQSFNPDNQTITATINYKRTFFQYNTATKAYDPVSKEYPILLDCPVVCLGGGSASLTFPIQVGDEALILFNDRDFGNWFQGSTTSQVPTPRLHSMADGIAIVGLRNSNRVIINYDINRVVLQNEDSKVAISNALVEISTAAGGSLGAALSTFFNALSSAATFGQINAAAAAAKLAIEDILE